MPNEILHNRLQTFTPEYLDFVMSDFTTVVGAEIQTKYNLDEDTKEAFENMLFLNITLFLNRIELIEAVIEECTMNIADAVEAVNTALAKLPKDMVVAQQEASIALTQNDGELVAEKDRFNFVNKLPAQKLYAYLYAKTAPGIDSMCQKHNIQSESTIGACHTLLGDITLGFYKIEDTVQLLQQELKLDPRTAALLGADVIDFLAPLKDPNWQPPQTNVAQPAIDTSTPMSIPVKSPIPSPVAAAAPAMPTMAPAPVYEPPREATYSSTQPSATNLSSIPSYMPPATPPTAPIPAAPAHDRPRWSSEV